MGKCETASIRSSAPVPLVFMGGSSERAARKGASEREGSARNRMHGYGDIGKLVADAEVLRMNGACARLGHSCVDESPNSIT